MSYVQRGAVDVLEHLDVTRFRTGFKQMFPHLPQPTSDAEALATMHMARTQSEAVAFTCRAYSHAWLLDRGLQSQLPDALKPKAEQIHPVKAYGVGIAVKAGEGKWSQESAAIKRRFQEDAVNECDADGRLLDREHVMARLAEARKKAADFIYG